jgi:hypothetical protein
MPVRAVIRQKKCNPSRQNLEYSRSPELGGGTMLIENETGASVSKVKWHHGDGRYLTRAECLSQVVEVRKRQGKPATLTEEESQLGLEDCHELLGQELKAEYVATVARIRRTESMNGPVGRWFVQLALAAMGTWGLILLISYGAVKVFGWPGWWWHVPYVVDSDGINSTGMIVGVIIGVVWATTDLMWPQHLIAQVFRWTFFSLILAAFSLPLWAGAPLVPDQFKLVIWLVYLALVSAILIHRWRAERLDRQPRSR